jgi:hypothetical protein
MAKDKSEREPTQRLPKTGKEIPLPKREDVFRDLRKGARSKRPRAPKR